VISPIRDYFRRAQAATRKSSKSKPLPRRQTMILEPLESRLLLSADLIGIPDWVDQGPAASINGQTSGLAGPNPVTGAIEAIAPHPTNANVIYVSTVTGGIWRTTDGGANWSPLTDQAASLSMSTIAYSPLDATNNTLFAGTGSFSSGGNGGPAVGALRTTDGGTTWAPIGSEFFGERVRALVPTSIGTSLADQVVLAATIDGGGVYRSTDGGTTFTIISGSSGSTDGLDNDADGAIDEAGELNLPFGSASHLVPDPTNANRFYAAVPGNGVFRSDNGGANWVLLPNLNTAGMARIELSVSAAGGAVYAGLISGGALQSVWRSNDQGANWAAIGVAPAIHPGTQGNTHFSILADRLANDVVYVGGDRQAGSPFVGNLFLGNATAGTWTSIVLGGTAGNTAPHADSRDMVFDANGNILESDDGGIYRLINPNAAGTDWQAFATLPRVAQFNSNIDYDQLNNAIIGGTQDTGSPEQISGFTWRDTSQADGGFVAVDNDQVAHPGTTLHYSSFQNFGAFTRTTIDNTNSPTGSAGVGLAVAGAGGSVLTKNVTIAGNRVNTFDATLPFLPPFVLNTIDPDQMLIGTNFLYESINNGDTLTSLGGLNNNNMDGVDNDQDGATDEGDEFTPAGAIGSVTAMVYGGRQGGVDNVALTYVASGATLRLRTAYTTNNINDFNIVAGYTGGSIRDIEIDPDDWSRGYVLTSGGTVWSFVNSGASVGDWTDVTGDLADFSGDIRDVELFTDTAAPGDDILLVSGFGGVFRTLDPSPTSQWSEYGANLPNVVATDLIYDEVDDVLMAGTYGRGAWNVTNVSDTIDVLGVLQITGDDDFAGQDDTITLIRNALNPALLDVFINDDFFQFQLSTIQQINVDSLGGNDTLIVDSTNGLIDVGNGIRYDGNGGVDDMELLQTDGPMHASDSYSVGPANGQGQSMIVGAGMDGTQMIWFENLEPVLDLVPAALLTVNATGEDNAINYSTGSLVTQGLVSIDAHETIEFGNKTALVINALAGADSVGINNAATPTGLATITINAGDPGSGDTMVITGAGVAVAVNTSTSTITGATGVGGAVPLSYSGIESLDLAGGITGLSFNSTAADDTLTVTPGASGAANNGTLVSSGALPLISFVNSGPLTANLDGGDDSVTVTGTPDADMVMVSGSAVMITGRNSVNYSGIESVAVNGGADSDTFDVTPSAVAVFIDGGDPVGALPGDLLNILAGGGSVTYNTGPEIDEGSFEVGANQPVSFDHIESFGITGSGPAVINATNGPDAITVIARDDSTHAMADGEQDFTVSVNEGPELLFIDVADLTVNALGGSDEVVLRAPAPNGAVWDVQVTIDGGPPSASDRLVVETPGAGAENVTYTPNASDGGTLDLANLTSLVTITQIEELLYDGEGDDDSLTVVGTGGDDTIMHLPGADDEAGSIHVNAFLPISYQNLGGGASLTVDGALGMDALIYYGTAVNDTFTVGGLGQVNLNSRLVVNSANLEALTLEGFDGDDVFTLVPAISASIYPTLNFHGGAGGDRVILLGTAGDDDIAISGQVASLGGVTVNMSGIEDISVDMLAGDDLLTYSGVSGVTEDITVSSSGVVGSGQVSVPGVTLVNFNGVERIDVIGNAPTPTETDSLTFAGTNAEDIFQINLAADGTDADPILTLQDVSLVTLLTLRNYTNFDTLHVLGLDGADTFNVMTGPITPVSRNLFVDGGLPSGKKKSSDDLRIFYTSPRPKIIRAAATQDPDAGLVDLDYGTARFLVQYDNIEQRIIGKA